MYIAFRTLVISICAVLGIAFSVVSVSAWTGPTASAPNNNVDAPINVGSSAQVKNGDLGVNNLTAFGNVQLDSAFNTPAGTPSYLNFSNSASPTWGSGGYGLRLNGSGRLEYNDSGTAGTWTGFSSSASQWVNGTGGAIYYNGGNVGIGTASPGAKVQVSSGNSPALLLGPNASWGQYLEVGGWRSGNYASVMASDGNLHIDSMTGHIAYLNYFNSGDIYLGYGGGRVMIGSGNIYPSAKFTIDTLGAGIWGMIVNYNWQPGSGTGAPSGPYGIYSYGSTYAIYGNGPIYGSSFLYTSDARFKHHVRDLDKGILTLMRLRPVSFTWNQNAPDTDSAGKDDIGFIAQEVEKIVPNAVHTDPKTGYKTLDYPKLIPILTKSIQDQQAQIDALTARIAKLEAASK